MDVSDAAHLIEDAVRGTGGTWADLGCGDGTFTLALHRLLGPTSRVYAVDRDPQALEALRRRTADVPAILPVTADFTSELELPGHAGSLDGILLANSLHYVEDAERVLTSWAARLRPEGRAVFVEYDRRGSSRWVPYPVPPSRLQQLATAAGLQAPVITRVQPSEFTGNLYAAFTTRAGAPPPA